MQSSNQKTTTNIYHSLTLSFEVTSLLSSPPSLRNDLYSVEWDVKLYYTIPYHTSVLTGWMQKHPTNTQALKAKFLTAAFSNQYRSILIKKETDH